MAVLLGTDVPQLLELLGGELLVVTRASAKQQLEEEAKQRQRELTAGVQPTTLDQIAGIPEEGDLSTVQENPEDEEIGIPVELRHLFLYCEVF